MVATVLTLCLVLAAPPQQAEHVKGYGRAPEQHLHCQISSLALQELPHSADKQVAFTFDAMPMRD